MVELIYDVHASESGALAVLDDLYLNLANDEDKSMKYIFVISTPEYKETENITVLRYPWVKKSWLLRLYFNHITTRKILKKYKPDKVYSLQNEGIPFYHGPQQVYLHLPFVLCDYQFDLKRDGKRIWLYQNVLSKYIFRSLRNADKVIVQTQWMKEALAKKAGVNVARIVVEAPDITTNSIGRFSNTIENRKRFFYPATAFHYKNHMTLLKAINHAVSQGLEDYEVILTIKSEENAYTHELAAYAEKFHLKIKFNGAVPRKRVFELYTNSILLFPSFVESFGLPLLEARMSDTFIIASDCPFSREILSGYKKAYFFDALDYKQMGKYILEVANRN